MRYVQAPHEFVGNGPAIFLAGPVSGKQDWQRQFMKMLPATELEPVVLNPRRDDFPHGDAYAEVTQIKWEHRHLSRADLVVFWFSADSLCPFTLFELGACCGAGAEIVVGCDPEYAQRFDIQVHLQIRRPEVTIVSNLDALAGQVTAHFRNRTVQKSLLQ